MLRIGAFHSRGTDRHSQYDQTRNSWLFLQQAHDRVLRYVTLDDVAFDDRNVALPDLGRHTVFCVYRFQLRVRNNVLVDLESIFL